MLPSGSIFFELTKRLIVSERAVLRGRVSQVVMFLAMCCFLLSWLWPVRGFIWQSFYQEISAFVGLSVLFFGLSPSRLLFTRWMMAVLVVALMPIIQLTLGVIDFWGDGWVSACYLIFFFAALCVGFNLALEKSGRALMNAFCLTVLVVSLLSSLIAVRQWLGIADSIWEIHYQGARPYANLAQPNHLASLLCFGLVSLIYFYERRALNRFSSSLIAIVLQGGLVVTQSRTAWVLAVVLLFLWIWAARRLNLRLMPAVIFGWILLFFGATILLPLLSDLLMLSSQSLADRAGSSARLDIWAAMIKAVAESPRLGFGWGQISGVQSEYSELFPIHSGLLTYSHNLFLDLLLWNGLWVGGGIIFFILWWQVKLLKSVASMEAFIALLIVAVFFTHAMFEYPYAYAYFLLPAGLMLGVAESSRGGQVSLLFPRWIRASFGVLVVSVMVLTVREYRYFEKNDFNRRMAQANIVGFDQVQLGGGVILLTQLGALQWFQRLDPKAPATASELERMGVLVARYPFLANLYRYCLALAANGYMDKARQQLAILRVIHGEEFYELALQQIGENLGEDARDQLTVPTVR